MSATVAPAPTKETKSIFLMSPEESGLLMVPSSLLLISTVTFFEGQVPTEGLKNRIVEIVQANPWLACRLKKQADGKKKKPAIVYDEQPSAKAIEEDHYREYSLDDIRGGRKELSAIDIGQPYEAIVKAMLKSDAKLSCGSECVGKNEPQFRVTVVPSTDGKRFALLISLSHVIADGYTYYEILNLLSFNAPMKELNPVRKQDFGKALKAAVGKVEYNFPGSAGYLFNALGNMIFGSKPKIRAHWIDKAKVAKIKEEAKKDSGGSVEFVSTNDVVTSVFGKLARTNVLEMAIDMRKRLPDYTKEDAGNYEFALYFRPDDFGTPSLIRQAVIGKDGEYGRRCTGSQTKLPGFWGASRRRIALITNWSSNHSGECFLGDGCKQELHLPLYKAPPLEAAIIFKPSPSSLGLITFARHIKKDAFKDSSSIFGESISDRIFSDS